MQHEGKNKERHKIKKILNDLWWIDSTKTSLLNTFNLIESKYLAQFWRVSDHITLHYTDVSSTLNFLYFEDVSVFVSPPFQALDSLSASPCPCPNTCWVFLRECSLSNECSLAKIELIGWRRRERIWWLWRRRWLWWGEEIRSPAKYKWPRWLWTKTRMRHHRPTYLYRNRTQNTGSNRAPRNKLPREWSTLKLFNLKS